MPGLMLAYLFSTQLVCGASFSAAELAWRTTNNTDSGSSRLEYSLSKGLFAINHIIPLHTVFSARS